MRMLNGIISLCMTLGSLTLLADQPVVLRGGDTLTVRCDNGVNPPAGGGSGIFAIEMFDNNNCTGTAKWGVRSKESCDASRPDFYCSSAKVIMSDGSTACVPYGRVEESECCKRSFENPPSNIKVEMFVSGDCTGDSKWTAFNSTSCADGNRPDFYCSSIRVTSKAASVCLPTSRVEESDCCKMGFR